MKPVAPSCLPPPLPQPLLLLGTSKVQLRQASISFPYNALAPEEWQSIYHLCPDLFPLSGGAFQRGLFTERRPSLRIKQDRLWGTSSTALGIWQALTRWTASFPLRSSLETLTS